MSKIKFKLNTAGVKELLKSAEMQAILAEKAAAMQSRCGDGYSHDVVVGKNRAIAMVKADTAKAKKDNMENNTLLKAVRG